jgi:hypothetical protein
MKKKSFCKLVTVLILALFVVGGCNKDDEEDNGSPTQPQNHALVIQNVTASPAAVQSAGWEWEYCYEGHRSALSCIAPDLDRDS